MTISLRLSDILKEKKRVFPLILKISGRVYKKREKNVSLTGND